MYVKTLIQGVGVHSRIWTFTSVICKYIVTVFSSKGVRRQHDSRYRLTIYELFNTSTMSWNMSECWCSGNKILYMSAWSFVFQNNLNETYWYRKYHDVPGFMCVKESIITRCIWISNMFFITFFKKSRGKLIIVYE